MIQILQPFEVGDGDSSCVHVQVRYDENSFLEQDYVGCGCQWSVGSLRYYFCFYVVCVLGRDDLFLGCRNENVTLFRHEVSFEHIGSRKSLDGSVFYFISVESLKRTEWTFGKEKENSESGDVSWRVWALTTTSSPFLLYKLQSCSITPMHLAPTLEQYLAEWKPTLPKPWN